VREVRAAYPTGNVHVDMIPDDLLEYLMVPGPVLRLLRAQMPNLTATQERWLDQFEHLMSPTNSFRRRWLTRSGTPGYSLDGFRAYAWYFMHGAGYLSRLFYNTRMRELIQNMNDEADTLNDATKRRQMISAVESHFLYLMEGSRDWAKMKAFFALWHLGFSVAAAGINLTQTPVVLLPYLGEVYGQRNTLRELRRFGSAVRTLVGRPIAGTGQIDSAREEMIRQGRINVGIAPELGAFAEGANLLHLMPGTHAQRF